MSICINTIWEEYNIYITAITGSAAAFIKGVTLHSATGIENTKYKVNDIRRQEYMSVKFQWLMKYHMLSKWHLKI